MTAFLSAFYHHLIIFMKEQLFTSCYLSYDFIAVQDVIVVLTSCRVKELNTALTQLFNFCRLQFHSHMVRATW
uniref:Uncharacterized protein n=1 Tax=Arundo donax TaxID=35708 RepID=A0A0A8YK73_ARUDO